MYLHFEFKLRSLLSVWTKPVLRRLDPLKVQQRSSRVGEPSTETVDEFARQRWVQQLTSLAFGFVPTCYKGLPAIAGRPWWKNWYQYTQVTHRRWYRYAQVIGITLLRTTSLIRPHNGRSASVSRKRSSGAVWKSRWPSWAPVPNKPTVSVDVKQHSTSEPKRPSLFRAQPSVKNKQTKTAFASYGCSQGTSL